MARNPFVDRLKVLGIAAGVFQAAKTAAENFLRAKDDQEEIPEADIRASIAPPVSDRVWNEIKKDLGIILVVLLILGGLSGCQLFREGQPVCLTQVSKVLQGDKPTIIDQRICVGGEGVR